MRGEPLTVEDFVQPSASVLDRMTPPTLDEWQEALNEMHRSNGGRPSPDPKHTHVGRAASVVLAEEQAAYDVYLGKHDRLQREYNEHYAYYVALYKRIGQRGWGR